jgi:hypothetical protein
MILIKETNKPQKSQAGMMKTVKRIQRKNFFDYEWKKNPNAVLVARPSKWGNPFKVKDYGLEKSISLYEAWLREELKKDPSFLDPLKGKDLVCYCPVNQPCHADIILKFLGE